MNKVLFQFNNLIVLQLTIFDRYSYQVYDGSTHLKNFNEAQDAFDYVLEKGSK